MNPSAFSPYFLYPITQIVDLLMHYADMFQMQRFNLIVIDECHYATGNHAYAVIMNKFYHAAPKDQERPHILGLTASPLVNVRENHSDEELDAMLTVLERTLDAKLASASGLISENLLIKSALEQVVHYQGTNVGRWLPSADNLSLHESRYREFRQLNQLYQDLGPLALTMYCSTLVKELSRNQFDRETPQEFQRAVQHLAHLAKFCEQECHNFPHNGRTDKLLALEELLEREIEELGGAETVGLVFVERRITAMALHNYFLRRNDELNQGNWERAVIARNKTVEEFPQVQVNKEEECQFDDSADDPFMIFQEPKPPPIESQTTPVTAPQNTQQAAPANTTPSLDQFMDADDDDECDDMYSDLPKPSNAKNTDMLKTGQTLENGGEYEYG
jgi:hypothetical protein